jgi:glycosyltransferase 2 family protein
MTDAAMEAPDVPPAQSRTRTILGAVVSIVALGGCVWWASNQSAPSLPDGAVGWSELLLALGVYTVASLIRGWRWDRVLDTLDIGHRRVDAYSLVAVGYMGNTVLPARGGELMRTFLLSERSSAGRREALGSIVTERLLDVVVLAGLFAVVALAGLGGSDERTGAYIAIAGLVVLAAAGWGYLLLHRSGRMPRLGEALRPLLRASRVMLTPLGGVLALATAACWCLEGLVFLLAARSIGVSLGFDEALVVVLLASLSGIVPAGPGFVGTYDAAALFALHRIDITGGTAVGAVLLFRLVVFVPITLVGLALMIGRYGGLRMSLRRARSADQLALSES